VMTLQLIKSQSFHSHIMFLISPTKPFHNLLIVKEFNEFYFNNLIFASDFLPMIFLVYK